MVAQHLGNRAGAAGAAQTAYGGREKLSVDGDEVRQVLGHVGILVDRLGRADRDADTAIDAFIGVDVVGARPFVDAIHRATRHAAGVLAVDAGVYDHVGHRYRPAVPGSMGVAASPRT